MFSRRMDIAVAAGFCRRMGTGFRAGVDLVKLIRMEEKAGSNQHRQILRSVGDGLANGDTLADRMRMHPTYFPSLVVSMVEVGETTGRLERTLLSLAEHYEYRVSMRRLFLLGITWPAVQLAVAIGVIGLLIWLLGVLSPAAGGQMIDVTGFGLRGTGGVVIYFAAIALIGSAIVAAVVAVRRNALGIFNVVPLFYRIPKLGPAIRDITLSRFCWTLAITLGAGLDPIRSVGLAMESTDSDYYRGGIKPATAAIQSGNSLSSALRQSEVIPEAFLRDVEVAELSGTDAESLEVLAGQYKARSQAAVRTLTGLMTAAIWLMFILIMVSMLFRMVMNVIGAVQETVGDLY